MRHELHSTNPIANVRQVRKRAIEPEILEPEEMGAILKQLEGVEPVRTAFLIAAIMEMRRGEIFGLKWSDVDLDRALLHVRRSYVDGVEGAPKTESSRRPLPLPPQVIEALMPGRQYPNTPSRISGYLLLIFISETNLSGPEPCGVGMLYLRSKLRVSANRAGLAHAPQELCFPAAVERGEPPSQHGTHATRYRGNDARSICTVGRGREERSGRKDRFFGPGERRKCGIGGANGPKLDPYRLFTFYWTRILLVSR
ncbi:MAG: integrase family protein [Edaphobacter sp.]|nr:integrase family protein [Edaphobacter sp.]